jgi:hypothetical protein
LEIRRQVSSISAKFDMSRQVSKYVSQIWDETTS